MTIDVVVESNPADMVGDLNDLKVGKSSNRTVDIAGDNFWAESSVD